MRFLILTIAIVLTSCATPYQKDGSGALLGGYKDYRLGENIFNVSFRGNNNTPASDLEPFLLYRCAELSLENGFEYFEVIKQGSDEKSGAVMTPSAKNSRASGQAVVNGNVVNTYASGSSYTIPSQFISYREKTLMVTIKTYKEKVSDNLYVANDIIKYLTPTVKDKK